MKVNDEYRHFVAIVAGENPEEQMEGFDINKKLDKPVIAYRMNDAAKLKNKYIEIYESLLKSEDLSKSELAEIEGELSDIKEMTDMEFFYDLTDEYEYDPETGDAITRDNPNGKWISFSIGKLFSTPFILNSGETAFSARKSDVNWSKVHLCNQDIYKAAWELVIDGKKPSNEEEEIIFNNMKNRTQYFLKFGNKENYVASSTSFWGFAFVKDYEWTELEDNIDQFEWMNNYYDRFIKPLPDDTLLTIYECRRD